MLGLKRFGVMFNSHVQLETALLSAIIKSVRDRDFVEPASLNVEVAESKQLCHWPSLFVKCQSTGVAEDSVSDLVPLKAKYVHLIQNVQEREGMNMLGSQKLQVSDVCAVYQRPSFFVGKRSLVDGFLKIEEGDIAGLVSALLRLSSRRFVTLDSNL